MSGLVTIEVRAFAFFFSNFSFSGYWSQCGTGSQGLNQSLQVHPCSLGLGAVSFVMHLKRQLSVVAAAAPSELPDSQWNTHQLY